MVTAGLPLLCHRPRAATRPKRAAVGKNRNRGFTLVELMIGVVIVAVLLGVAAPSFRSFILDQQLRATTADLRIAVTRARSEAVKRNRVVQLLPSAGGWNSGWRIPSPNGGDPDLLVHVQGAQLTLSVSAAVQFSPMGRATSAVEFELDIGADSSDTLGCIKLALDGGITSTKGACADA
jgi:type IV fimbrial biogenesis protein FimT